MVGEPDSHKTTKFEFLNQTRRREKNMLKRMLIISVVLFSMVAISNRSWAASTVPDLSDTTYDIKGKLTAKINFPNLISITATLPQVYNFGETFSFYDDGTFEDALITALLGFSDSIDLPTWEQTGSNFTVDLTPLSDSLSAMLSGLDIPGFTVTGEPSSSPTITGKVASNGNISGNINLGWDITIEDTDLGLSIDGTLSITLKFTGTPEEEGAAGKVSRSLSKSSKASVPLNIKKLISDALTSIPLKGATPVK